MALSREQKPYLTSKLRYLLDVVKGLVGRPWSDLRGISNSSAAKSTILIPLVGYWIIFNETIFGWLQLAHQVGGHPSDHTRVRWLYLGLCSIAVGTFICAWRCPPEVKKYRDYKDYVNGDGPAIHRDDVEGMRTALEKYGYSELFHADEKQVITVYYDHLDRSELASRIAATLLFAVGFFILTVLSLRVFARVVWFWSAN